MATVTTALAAECSDRRAFDCPCANVVHRTASCRIACTCVVSPAMPCCCICPDFDERPTRPCFAAESLQPSTAAAIGSSSSVSDASRRPKVRLAAVAVAAGHYSIVVASMICAANRV